jgi:hypothetical protein
MNGLCPSAPNSIAMYGAGRPPFHTWRAYRHPGNGETFGIRAFGELAAHGRRGYMPFHDIAGDFSGVTRC